MIRRLRGMLFLMGIGMLGSIATAGSDCTESQERVATVLEGEIIAGETSRVPFGPGFAFALLPIKHGWEISVAHQAYPGNLARLTPPWHFVPNPRYIEGWHFRNAANTGPNDGSVNAPQKHRDFIFSPEVNRIIGGPDAGREPTPEEIERVRQFGEGHLEILAYELTGPRNGERAAMVRLRYRVCLLWQRDFPRVQSAKGAS